MSYFVDLCREAGLRARTLVGLIEEVMQAPTDRKLHVVMVTLLAAKGLADLDDEATLRTHDLISILAAEREWLRNHPEEIPL